jgi:hypothetical protein
MDNSKIMKRIRSLMAMAADSSSPHEAAIAARRAKALMDQYQLDNADLVYDELESGEGFTEQTAGSSYKAVPGWHKVLTYGVCLLTDTQALYVSVCDGGRRVEFRGYAPDVELAGVLLAFLVAQMEGALKARRAALGRKVGRKWANDYRYGFATTVQNRAKSLKAERDAESTGTDLAIYKADALVKHYGKQKLGTSRHSLSHRQGSKDGAEARLHLDMRHQNEGRYLARG